LFGVNHLLDVIHSVKSVDKLSKVINDLSHLINDLFTNCQKVMIDRYPIHITHRSSKKSIQSDNYWSIYSVRRVLLTERTHRQTDKQTATLILIYNKKNIFIYHKRLILFPWWRCTYTQYKQTEAKHRAAPHCPP
jgi:hypothetical protein